MLRGSKAEKAWQHLLPHTSIILSRKNTLRVEYSCTNERIDKTKSASTFFPNLGVIVYFELSTIRSIRKCTTL